MRTAAVAWGAKWDSIIRRISNSSLISDQLNPRTRQPLRGMFSTSPSAIRRFRACLRGVGLMP